jgi:lipopolysaccharide/colanic/teichoic acid biosynthesis glycosyltransferase
VSAPTSIDSTEAGLRNVSRVYGRVLDEEGFSRMISLERKRTERSQRLFLLMLLDIRRVLVGDGNGETLSKILSVLSPSIRETDVTGWHKENAVLGVMFTEVPTEARKTIVSTMMLRVRGVLYRSLRFEQFNQLNISYHVFPEEWHLDVPQRPSHPTLYPDLLERDNGSKLFSVAKRTMDIIGGALGLLIGSPLLLLIALTVKLSSKGPILFRQQRVGQYGAPFVFLKFRSMYVNNDSRIHKEYVSRLIAGQAEHKPSNGNGQGVYKLRGDPRVTRVGMFLRKTSLDELPQFYNVLKGEMSLVGPRPSIPYEVEAYDVWHRRRVLEAKPGITGLWQVNGRSRVTFDEMVRLDVRYSSARSLWLDLKILMRTPRAVISAEGAL